MNEVDLAAKRSRYQGNCIGYSVGSADCTLSCVAFIPAASGRVIQATSNKVKN